MANSNDYQLSLHAQLFGAEQVERQLENIEKRARAVTSIALEKQRLGLAPKDTRSEADIYKTSLAQEKLGAYSKAVMPQQGVGDAMMMAAKRALLVAPVWMAIRAAMQAVIGTISDMVKANMDLDSSMARIRTVMTTTGAVLEAEMAKIKTAILGAAINSRTSMKDLGDAFYFLKTSALNTDEAMAGFNAAVLLMDGTLIGGKEAARGLAGMYNTLGKTLPETMSPMEKMTYIADTLAYVYQTQDVEMNELMESYNKFAPAVVGLDDNFRDIVTTLAFLNTHLLRGGRAGRLTMQSFIELGAKSDKLRAIFGITFDPKAPISFIKTLGLIHAKLGDTSKMTAAQGAALKEIFGTRSQQAVRLLLGHYEAWMKALGDGQKTADGLAAALKKIQMNTFASQAQRFSNILAVLGNDFISAAAGAGSFLDLLTKINDAMSKARPLASAAGEVWNNFWSTITQSAMIYAKWLMIINDLQGGKGWIATAKKWGPSVGQALMDITADPNDKAVAQRYKENQAALEAARTKSFSGQKKEQEDIQENITQEENKVKELKKNIELEQSDTRRLNLLQLMGANELMVANYKTAQARVNVELAQAEYERLEKQKDVLATAKAETAVAEAELELQKSITEQIKQRGLMSKALMDSEKKKASDLAVDYANADPLEKGEIRRTAELRAMSPEDLAKLVEEYGSDRQRILDDLDNLTERQNEEVRKVLEKEADLQKSDITVTNPAKSDAEAKAEGELQAKEEAHLTRYWDSWQKYMLTKTAAYEEELKRIEAAAEIRAGEGKGTVTGPDGVERRIDNTGSEDKYGMQPTLKKVKSEVDLKITVHVKSLLDPNDDLTKQFADEVIKIFDDNVFASQILTGKSDIIT